MLLAIDGIDGTGKDTQAQLLYEELLARGFEVEVVACPTADSPLNPIINMVLQDIAEYDPRCLQLLFIAERLREQSRWSSSVQSRIVILVRSVWATLVYGEAQGIDTKWLLNLILPVKDPDVIFFLDLTVEEAMGRGSLEDPLEADVNFQTLCRQRYLDLVSIGRNLIKVEGRGTPDEVHERVVTALQERFPEYFSS